jgi:peptidoglycan/xylan/chitin deacetylase (PgdA/CDA1 family)
MAAVEVAMGGIARALGRILFALVVAALLAQVAAPAIEATTSSLRLQAGPQRTVTFDASWHATSTRTTTLSSPVTVTASARHAMSSSEAWIRIASGSLRGRWVRESSVAYIPGFQGRTTYSPPRAGTLAAATYELYRFASTGAMTEARPWQVAVATPIETSGRAWINGRPYVQLASSPNAGWWVPGSTSAPVPIRCTAGSPPDGAAAAIVRSVPSATGEIALTFDMGGRLTDGVAIVHLLTLERVCATIFPTGTAASTTTGRQVLAAVAAHPELFEVGNHTVHHCNLRDGGGGGACPAKGTRPSGAFVTRELTDAEATVSAVAGGSTHPYWRPPYGAVDTTLARVAAAAGYPYTMMWSTDTIDWRPISDGGPTSAQIAAKVVQGRTAGGIVLMHLGGYHTRNALFAMVKGLRDAGYTPTTLSGLYRAGP